ncbi:hypothetical protein ABND49_18155 [Paenibacillus larvae]|uniref:Putative transposase n=2 Tax=Paenibacillus larvae TaxID=1464 RepID=V9W2P4_9BACL|nr:hypothetical protein [Paenibacillus larvae]AHD04408.1 putative transposase [Paenibacillus larvae subsp. larvae DSM 25430]AQR78364.1 hypothetical protein BXP28_14615 [Paenibacillus larvae subsp. larvae]MDR5594777.1 hypothetical protein [Paenibacillus larvae]MDV3486376.1 hypothetical protein [Paenibacillus larvae]
MAGYQKVSPFHMDIYHEGNLIYRHKKALYQSDHQYIPEHYLKILERKPRAIINAAPLKGGVLPHELSEFMSFASTGIKTTSW